MGTSAVPTAQASEGSLHSNTFLNSTGQSQQPMSTEEQIDRFWEQLRTSHTYFQRLGWRDMLNDDIRQEEFRRDILLRQQVADAIEKFSRK
jgi:hypothetical protein